MNKTILSGVLALSMLTAATTHAVVYNPTNKTIPSHIDIPTRTLCYVLALQLNLPKVANTHVKWLNSMSPVFYPAIAFYRGRAEGMLVGTANERFKTDEKTPEQKIVAVSNELFPKYCAEKI